MTSLYGSMTVAVLSAALSLFGTSAQAGVVFGNLGPSGTNALGGTNTDYGPSDSGELSLAQGFVVPFSVTARQLESVTLGLFTSNSGSRPMTVSIYSWVGGVPGVPLYTSGTVDVGNTGLYTFPFTGVTFPGPTTASYFVVPNGSASWYTVLSGSAPTEQNGSGYIFDDTLRNQPSVGWTQTQFGIQAYAVSIQAVPEPPAVVLSGIGLASAFYALSRRRT